MRAGKKLDNWFYQRLTGKKTDINRPFSTDWHYSWCALRPLFKRLKIDEMYVYWEEPMWACELVLSEGELTTSIKKYSNTALAAIVFASGELLGNMRNRDGENGCENKK